MHRTQVVVYIDDFSHFTVYFDDDGEAYNVVETRTVWSKQRGAVSAVMSERVRRAIETAKRERDQHRETPG